MHKSNRIIHGNCIEIMNEKLDERSVDLIFADPPYNLQLENELYRPNETKVNGVEDSWDKFETLKQYDDFTTEWLSACQRVLKDDGCIWIIGTYHNIFRMGKILQDLGFWILNDIVWVKTNPMPNFRGVRFTNAHETLIWAKKSKDAKYTFNYRAMKNYNDDLQMRSDWNFPLCTGNERLMDEEGKKLHSTQKPSALLRRIILSSTNIDDIVLDPYFGTGTTGAVAQSLKRRWIGIEKELRYIDAARDRISKIRPSLFEDELYETPSKKDLPKVSFGNLLEVNFLKEGNKLYSSDKQHEVVICADGSLKYHDFRGSIHKTGAHVQNRKTCNGWDFWLYKDNGTYKSIDNLRNKYRELYIY